MQEVKCKSILFRLLDEAHQLEVLDRRYPEVQQGACGRDEKAAGRPFEASRRRRMAPGPCGDLTSGRRGPDPDAPILMTCNATPADVKHDKLWALPGGEIAFREGGLEVIIACEGVDRGKGAEREGRRVTCADGRCIVSFEASKAFT